MKRCAKSSMIVSLNACRTGDCVDKVNGYTCDCDEDHELMLQLNGSACVARNVKKILLQRVQIESVPVRHVHSTEGCVCGSMFNMVARAHTCSAQCSAAAVQQPEGWRIVDPAPCWGGSTHRWVPVDTHSNTGARKGWLWVAHVIRQHSSTVQKHPKNGSGAMSIQGKSCNKIHENHDDQYSVKCPIPGDGYR